MTGLFHLNAVSSGSARAAAGFRTALLFGRTTLRCVSTSRLVTITCPGCLAVPAFCLLSAGWVSPEALPFSVPAWPFLCACTLVSLRLLMRSLIQADLRPHLQPPSTLITSLQAPSPHTDTASGAGDQDSTHDFVGTQFSPYASSITWQSVVNIIKPNI